MNNASLKRTPLYDLHKELGARLVPFAGYEMPVQYTGVLAEHNHTRDGASLFDVSHMGQAIIDDAAQLERLVTGDIRGLKAGRQLYTLLTNEDGGIIDDLMVTNTGEHLHLVVNAGCKDKDFAHMRRVLDLRELPDRALLALQGPKAAEVMGRLADLPADMVFMTAAEIEVGGVSCFVTRSGYTGEDGFEISVPADQAEALALSMLAHDEVEAAGLGCRDSLRLEAGLCLYGNDIDETTSPVEAGLTWAIGKSRRQSGGFPGDRVILDHLANGVARKRVGLKVLGKAPARAHTEIQDSQGRAVGEITSGGPSPTLGHPVAMGYVETGCAALGTKLNLVVRGRTLAAEVVKMPFVQQRYYRG